MNIAPTFPEAALLITSSYQRREPRADSMADYDKAMAEFERLQFVAHDLERWQDRDVVLMWSVPCGWLDDQIRDARSAAAEAWRKARDIRSKLRRAA